MIPEITVYTPSHNYGHFLEEAIESVLRQTVDDWELLIIDDNSTDNTPEVMARYEGDERIRLFSTHGIGLPAVCNLALKEAKGKYMIRLDGDDIFDENILLVLRNYLERTPSCALVFPDYYDIDEYGEVLDQKRQEKVYIDNHILDIPANGACSLIRKNVLEQLGGYREDLGAQDGFDLWVRLKEQYKVANVNLPLFYYRRHGSNLTNRSRHIIAARQKIKSDSIADKIEHYRPIIAVIPCRRNYDFCQDVWKRELCGKTLLERNIAKCLQSSIFDHIVIAADNPEVEEIVQLFDDSRIKTIQRKTENTFTSMGFAATLEKVNAVYDPDLNGISAISYIQAAFVATETIEESICTLILNDVDSAFGVEEIKEKVYKREAHGIVPINPSKGFTRDFDTIFREAYTSFATRNRNLRTGSTHGPAVVNFMMSSEESFFIDSELKLQIAEILIKNKTNGII